jgi:hypothetical protein
VTNTPTGHVEDWADTGQAMLDAIAATKMEARMNDDA